MFNIRDLDTRMRGALAEMKALGSIDQYYIGRVNGAALGPNEVLAAEYIRQWYEPGATVVEVGCGYGQLSLLLAAMGFNVFGTERDAQRQAGARYLLRAMPEECRYTLLEGAFPEVQHPPYQVMVAGNVVNSWYDTWPIPHRDKLSRMLRGKDAVLDLRVWWTVRDEGEQARLREDIESLGYAAEHVGSTVWAFHGERS